VSSIAYDAAIVVQQKIAKEAGEALGRFVASSISYNKSTDAWVVHLQMQRRLHADEIGKLQLIGRRHPDVLLDVLDDMGAPRLAFG